MSRIGNQPVQIPPGVTVEVKDWVATVKGPKGTLTRQLNPLATVEVEGAEIVVKRANESRQARGMHGLTRTLLANMVQGVVTPFEKNLEISGVGYRAELKGDILNLQLGLSHDVNHPIPAEVTCRVDRQTQVFLSACDKELVGQVAASIRAYRPCEPYKGKGIKYKGEQVRRKEGKKSA